ncbi:MAG TPA: pyroglutamyl-peptidase I [Ramlibacter sp.]|jgi:pyroglutamyl-peptidase|uniref:pyroglutamyl-peptidase I n=1 Tax=Ramlibacter sp. TaxID=1917967 RepID=UPI002D22E8EA|nr:pyroglutamyl-peptidase I [Ramlibacter sp.]HZY19031.1 pyroglutamyl-peptidase I [Ramlibacter sp.]
MLSAPAARTVGQPRILVTGFDPFGGQPVNPSWLAAQALDGLDIEGHRVVSAQLPTRFASALPCLQELLAGVRPSLVLCTGQAGGRSAISFERVAINVNDARIPDNGGEQPIDTPVIEGGPAAYFSTLPIKAMMAALLGEGIRADVSQSAGTFVCNHVFYGLMHLLATDPRWAGVRGGMVHVPWLPQQGQPSMTQEQVVHGLQVALRCAVRTRADLRLQAGAIS